MAQVQENKMGIMPVNKLVVTMSVPIIVAMIVQALYNVVDSYFVSLVSTEALTAVGQAFSAQNLMIGMATGTGVGMNALLSRALGQKDHRLANRIACNGLLIAAAFYVLMLLFGLFGTDIYFQGMLSAAQVDGGLNLDLVRQYGNDYLRVCSVFSFGMFGQIMFERIMQATGRTVYTMLTQGAGAIINIILDPIFILEEVPIFHFKGLNMGAAGAAYATVIGQIVAFIFGVILNIAVNKEIQLKLKGFLPDFKIIGNICEIGIPSIIMVAIGSVMYYLMNIIIMTVSSIGATVFGVYYKLQSFVFMPVFGLNNGVIPILGFNYGAGKRKRFTKAVFLSCIYALVFMVIGVVLMQLIPDKLLGLFELNEGEMALRIISLSFVFAGVSICLSSVFQALSKGMHSMFISIARQLVVLVPVAWLLSLSGDVNLIWWAFPIAEAASFCFTGILYLVVHKKIISKISENGYEPQNALEQE